MLNSDVFSGVVELSISFSLEKFPWSAYFELFPGIFMNVLSLLSVPRVTVLYLRHRVN